MDSERGVRGLGREGVDNPVEARDPEKIEERLETVDSVNHLVIFYS